MQGAHFAHTCAVRARAPDAGRPGMLRRESLALLSVRYLLGERARGAETRGAALTPTRGAAMTVPPTFGALLGRARRAAGVTQETLAARAGVSARAISDLERGVKHVPRRDTVRLLIAALPLSPQERALFEDAARLARGAFPPTPVAALTEGSAAPDRPVPAPRPVAPPLIGQLRARAALARHVAGDGPPVLALTGEPGIGKTRLLAWAAERGATRGLRVLRGRGRLRSGPMPHEPVLDALRAYIRERPPLDLRDDLRGCAWLVRALPEVGDGPIEPLPLAGGAPAPTPAREHRLVEEAIARFVSNIAGPGGALLVLDDLHAADPADLDRLLALLGTDAPPRVIAAYRDTEVRRGDPLDALLATLAQAHLATRLAIPRLAPPDAAHLLDDLLREVDTVGSAVRERVLRRADGVPFVLVAWARDLGLEPAATDVTDRVPWAVAQSVRQRIDAAPAVVRTALEVASVVGGPMTPQALLPWVAGATEAGEALDAAAQAGLVRAAMDGYHVAHDVIRAVVVDDLGPARSATLRRRLEEVTATREVREGWLATGARGAPGATDGDDPEGDRAVMDERRRHLAVLTQRQRASDPDAARESGGRP